MRHTHLRRLLLVLALIVIGSGILPATAQDGDPLDVVRADYPRVRSGGMCYTHNI